MKENKKKKERDRRIIFEHTDHDNKIYVGHMS